MDTTEQSTAAPQVAVIGVGTMGAPMAGHLIDAGYRVRVYNRTRSRLDPLLARGAVGADTPALAAEGAQAVLTCVSDGPDLEQVVLGPDGVAQTLAAGAVLLDCSTVSPQVARTLAAELARTGRRFVDAPVSGGSQGAVNGTLTVFAGGEPEAFALAKPVLQAFASRITHLGPVGSGQAGKAVNQIMLAGIYAGVAEGVALAERCGLPAEDLLQALAGGSADSWVLRNRGAGMVADSYPLGFRTRLHLKDVRIALAEAAAGGLQLPVAELVAAQEDALLAAGFGDEDVSNLARSARGQLASESGPAA